MLERTLIRKLAIPFLTKGTLRWVAVITSIPSWTITLFIKRRMSAGFPFLQDLFLSGVPLSKEFRRGELDSREPLPFLWVLATSVDRVSFLTYLFERTDLLLSTGRNISLVLSSLPLNLPLAAAGPGAAFSRLSFPRRETLLTSCLFEVPDHHLFSVWCSREIHLF